MAGKTGQVKGIAKEAVGGLIGNEKLESEGKADRRAGEAEESIDNVKKKVDHVVEKAKDRVVSATKAVEEHT